MCFTWIITYSFQIRMVQLLQNASGLLPLILLHVFDVNKTLFHSWEWSTVFIDPYTPVQCPCLCTAPAERVASGTGRRWLFPWKIQDIRECGLWPRGGGKEIEIAARDLEAGGCSRARRCGKECHPSSCASRPGFGTLHSLRCSSSVSRLAGSGGWGCVWSQSLLWAQHKMCCSRLPRQNHAWESSMLQVYRPVLLVWSRWLP